VLLEERAEDEPRLYLAPSRNKRGSQIKSLQGEATMEVERQASMATCPKLLKFFIVFGWWGMAGAERRVVWGGMGERRGRGVLVGDSQERYRPAADG
jgi:hypothetical protein